MQRVNIILKPRIHITLIGMNHNGYRKNGGIGFALSSPELTLHACKSVRLTIRDQRSLPHTSIEHQRLEKILQDEINKHNLKEIELTIGGDVPTHYGFGTTTSIRMAALEALYLLNEHSYVSEELVFKSKRGGTSGVGVNTYYNGGFVFDLGVLNNNILLPSSVTENRIAIPQKLIQLNSIPWKAGICIPLNIPPKSEAEEVEFFNTTCPISDSEVNEILYHCLYGVCASIIDNDYYSFCSAINNIQKSKWKASERSLYGKALVDLETQLYTCGADAVGMSSLGPSLFFFAKDLDNVIGKLQAICFECAVYIADIATTGRVISYV